MGKDGHEQEQQDGRLVVGAHAVGEGDGQELEHPTEGPALQGRNEDDGQALEENEV